MRIAAYRKDKSSCAVIATEMMNICTSIPSILQTHSITLCPVEASCVFRREKISFAHSLFDRNVNREPKMPIDCNGSQLLLTLLQSGHGLHCLDFLAAEMCGTRLTSARYKHSVTFVDIANVWFELRRLSEAHRSIARINSIKLPDNLPPTTTQTIVYFPRQWPRNEYENGHTHKSPVKEIHLQTETANTDDNMPPFGLRYLFRTHHPFWPPLTTNKNLLFNE